MSEQGRKFLDGTTEARRVTFFIDKETVDFLMSIPGPHGKKGNMSMGLRTLCKETKKMAEDMVKYLDYDKNA